MRKRCEEIGLRLIRESLIDNRKLLAHLLAERIELKICPCGFYVQSFRK